MIFRFLCDEYDKLPSEIECLTLDQIYLLCIPREQLQETNVIIKGSPEELVSMGYIDPSKTTKTMTQIIRERIEAERKTMSRRERRRQRRQQLIEYKRQSNGV